MKPQRGSEAHATKRVSWWRMGLIAVALAAVCSACDSGASATTDLVGTFHLAPGRCSSAGAPPTGSYFVVGNAADGKPVPTAQGACADKMFVPLSPGTDGGLVTGTFQPDPAPTFSSNGSSLAALIIVPVNFQGQKVGMATSGYDDQNAPSAPPIFPVPTATVVGSHLYVDLRSLHFSYGGLPGSTCATSYGQGCWDLGSKSAAGTYDRSTRQFTLDWFVGEAFSEAGDSIEVHFAGTFVPRAGQSG
jgi:hypothetical protein